ncbi:MAG: hypothetical protein ACK4F6_19210, partial [Hylemonella sp.]
MQRSRFRRTRLPSRLPHRLRLLPRPLQLLPHHLLVVARRFEYDWATDTARKRCERLDFPLLLPLPTALDGQRGAGVCRYGLYAV